MSRRPSLDDDPIANLALMVAMACMLSPVALLGAMIGRWLVR